VKAIVGDKLDILVANAGISGSAAIEDQTIEKFDNLLRSQRPCTLLPGPAAAALISRGRQLDPDLFARGEGGGRRAVRLLGHQGAVDTLVKYFAAALGPGGIRVNAVAPVIATEMSSFAKTDAGREFVLGMQALKRIGQPEDVGFRRWRGRGDWR
jgi:3-oxoacyl-[acyl-carrier protein] reductase